MVCYKEGGGGSCCEIRLQILIVHLPMLRNIFLHMNAQMYWAGLGRSVPSLGRWLSVRQPDPLFLSFTSKWPRCGIYFLTLPAEFPNYFLHDRAMQSYESAHPRALPYIAIHDVFIWMLATTAAYEYWPLLFYWIRQLFAAVDAFYDDWCRWIDCLHNLHNTYCHL